MEPENFKLKDIFNGIIIPLILVLLIFVLAIYVNVSGAHAVLGTGAIGVILTQGFAQMIVLGVPMVLGLLWNRWAGGAAGFIMGGMYYVAAAGLYTGYYVSSGTAFYHDFFGAPNLLFWLVNGVIIGYMAGALNNGSTNFKRMLGAGLTAAMITATLQALMDYFFTLDFKGASEAVMQWSPRAMAHGQWADTSLGIPGAYGFVLAFVPAIALGVIVPVLAKVMTWYGMKPMRHQ